MKMKFKVVAIGNPVYDEIITPYLKTDGRVLSGCSTNAVLAVSKLGVRPVALIGSVGKDHKERFLSDLKKYGIDETVIVPAEETGGFKLIYDKTGDRTLDVLGIANKITQKDIPEDFLHAEFIAVGPILQEVDLDLIEWLKESTNAKIFLDPQGLVRKVGADGRIIRTADRKIMKKVMNYVDFVKPNEHESVVITGEKDPMKSAEILSDWGAPVAIVTLAERGSIVYDGETFYKIPAYETLAKDSTGAGDTYMGTFIVEYGRTKNIPEAALYASAGASMMVEQTGPDFIMTDEEIKKRRESIRDKFETL